jgi:hypothetical protein
VILCDHRVRKWIGMISPSPQSSPSAQGRGSQAVTFGGVTLTA